MVRRIIKKFFFMASLAWLRGVYLVAGVDAIVASLKSSSGVVAKKILIMCGATVGAGLVMRRGVMLENPMGGRAWNNFSNLSIGEDCFIGTDVYFDLADKIIIENDVVISARSVFLTHADCGERAMRSWFKRKQMPIRIGYGTWIGTGAIIMPGVEIGECCAIGAGAVVTKSIPNKTVVAGVPAVELRRLA